MKLLLPAALALLLAASQAQAKAVFAHFLFSNTVRYKASDWEDDMQLAKDAHIDAFALNIIHGDRVDELSTAFEIAEKTNFKLFLSFDYANDPKGYGSWLMEDVLTLMRRYSGHKAYYRHDGKPFVTTFEGASNIRNWKAIKEATGCYFVPNWGSLGAKQAARAGNGIVDGLTSWTAWPWGAEDMNTYTDAAYIEALSSDSNSDASGVPYMMPVSPWFYANLDEYKKNWLWGGDDLWYNRWQQVFLVQPEFLMIISWNGYGESHYIGPLRENALVEFEEASVNYARDMPHDGWRLILPYLVDTYKNGIATVKRESLIAWHRLQPAQACSDGNTTGNTAGYLQYEFAPHSIVQDKIFFSAVLTSRVNISMQIGDAELTPEWKHVPEGEAGLYHGSVSFSGHTGTTVVNIWRGEKIIAAAYANTITNDCSKTGNRSNWNAWVGLGQTPWDVSATPKLSLRDQACVNGTGWDELKVICEFTCSYGYCPLDTCYCTTMGTPQEPLDTAGMIGYPVPGKDDRYILLCAWSCANGYCPETLCGTQQVAPVPRNDTWYLHDTCTSGTGKGKLAGLCKFACAYGYCPKHACECKETGPLLGAPSGKPVLVSVKPWLNPFLYEGLCNFACSHGYCPSAICDGPTMIGGLGDVVLVDPGAWRDPAPTMTCSLPCTLVPAPLTLGTPSVIDFEPWSTVVPYSSAEDMETTFRNGKTTHYTVYSTIDVTTALQIEPVTTTAIDVWAITISDIPENDEVYMTSSVQPPPFVITISTTHNGKQWPPMTTTITPFPYPTSRLTTPDPELNTRPTKITTGDPGPLCTAGCGRPCFLFCQPDCPHCPPGFIAPGITLPPGAISPSPAGIDPPPVGNPPSGPGNPGEIPTPTSYPTTTGTISTTASTSTATPKQTTLAPAGTMLVGTAPTRADYLHLRGTVSPTLSSRLSSLYSNEQACASDGVYYSRPSTIPASAVTGIAVASYELCDQKSAPPCTYGFAVHAVASPSWGEFGTCLMKRAIYTTDVSSGSFKMTLAATPSIGPFDVGNKGNCYWDNGGISCERTAFCGRCPVEICGRHFEVFCAIGGRGSGPAENVGMCAW